MDDSGRAFLASSSAARRATRVSFSAASLAHSFSARTLRFERGFGASGSTKLAGTGGSTDLSGSGARCESVGLGTASKPGVSNAELGRGRVLWAKDRLSLPGTDSEGYLGKRTTSSSSRCESSEGMNGRPELWTSDEPSAALAGTGSSSVRKLEEKSAGPSGAFERTRGLLERKRTATVVRR